MSLNRLNLILFCVVMFFFRITTTMAQDTIPPQITISDEQIYANYPISEADVYYFYSADDTLEVELTCLFRFPGEYYFDISNATITDNIGISSDTIVVDSIFRDDKGYGTVFQTIIAEDYSGNISKMVIIARLSYLYDFNFLGLEIGDIPIGYNTESYTLEITDVDLCAADNVNIAAYYSKNGCTGFTKINWYVDDQLFAENSDGISLDLANQPENIKLEVEAAFSNTAYGDRIPVNLHAIVNDSYTQVHNPTCKDSRDGEIFLDPLVSNVYWHHNGSGSLNMYSLDTGNYIVSYQYNECQFTDTITLETENIYDFSVSDTVINLNQNEILTITNLSESSHEYLWQIGDSSFVNSNYEFNYSFTSAGTYDIKLTGNYGICTDTITRRILVEGTLPFNDTIPPEIIIDEEHIRSNYSKGINGFDGDYVLSNNFHRLNVVLSCIYSFPEDYYFKLENVIIEDESDILMDTIIVDNVIYDNDGYGSISQTVVAEDVYGNISEFEIITTVSETKYRFDILGMNVGGIDVGYNESTFTLDDTDFEFCTGPTIDVNMFYSKNGCTGYTKVNWYINDELVSTNSDGVTVDLGNEPGGIVLAAEAKYNNTNYQDRIKINLQQIINNSNHQVTNPTCINSGDGTIRLDVEVSNVTWEHTASDASILNYLNPGSYFVSYTYNSCNFNDTITLIPENIIDFTLSDTIINLSSNETLTIQNISNLAGDYSWKIGDSNFINNSINFDYTFKSSGNYEIILTNINGICNSILSKNILVEGILAVDDTIPPTIAINWDFLYEYFKPPDELPNENEYVNYSQKNDTLIVSYPCKLGTSALPITALIIEDNSGIYQDTIIVEYMYDEQGYSIIFQTIIAEDNSGNVSKFVIKSNVDYFFNYESWDLNVGFMAIPFGQTYIELCDNEIIDISLALTYYDLNFCVEPKISWYINDTLVSNDYYWQIDMSNESDNFELKVEPFGIKLNIGKIKNNAVHIKNNPSCWNIANGSIILDKDVYGVYWEHNGSTQHKLDSLEVGTYFVSYDYHNCIFRDSITLTNGIQPPFDFLGMTVNGEIVVDDGSFDYSTDIEFCNDSKFDIELYTSKNGCTGNTKINWLINDDIQVASDTDTITIDMNDKTESFVLTAAAPFSNTNFQNIIINFQKKENNSNSIIHNPFCSNSADGSISLDARVENVIWEHNSSNAKFLNSLEAGSYYVSYTYNGCEFNDTITLVPENILDFTISDTVIDLNQGELLTMYNTSTAEGDFLWQIGDSTFINNAVEFEYVIGLPGEYPIKLTNMNENCTDSIQKKVTVKNSTYSFDPSAPYIKIGPNPFNEFINIDFGKASDYNVSIYGVDGRIYYSDKVLSSDKIQTDLRFLFPGVYVLNITSVSQNEPIKEFKIVKLNDD